MTWLLICKTRFAGKFRKRSEAASCILASDANRMVSGRLLDASGEFFIQSMPGFSGGLDISGAAHADGAARDAARAAEWHHGFQVCGSLMAALGQPCSFCDGTLAGMCAWPRLSNLPPVSCHVSKASPLHDGSLFLPVLLWNQPADVRVPM